MDEPWLEAQLILDCEDENLLQCTAHYQAEVDSSEH